MSNTKRVLLIVTLTLNVIAQIKSQEENPIAEILKNLDIKNILNSPIMLKVMKDQIKKELVSNLRTGIKTLKKETEIYKDGNKELIDGIESSLNDYNYANTLEEEKKILVEIMEKFKKFINSNENFEEKQTLDSLINSIETMTKFFTENTNKGGKDEKFLNDSTNSNTKNSDASKIPKKEEKQIPPHEGSFLLSPLMLVLFASILVALLVFIYCKYIKKRVSRRDIEYIQQANESTVQYE